MPNSSGEPKPTEAQDQPSNGEELDQNGNGHIPPEAETVAQEPAPDTETEGATESPDWWTPSPPTAESDETSTAARAVDLRSAKASATADVYFCGSNALLPLNRALQAIAKERLTGSLRAFWDREPVELFTKEGAIAFVTTRDPDLYCKETPAVLANVDPVLVDRARAQQNETGTPFFITLAREEAIAHHAATELVQHYGQQLFSQLWMAPRVWTMFEKNAELLSDAPDVSVQTNVDDWALETLRFVQTLDQPAHFDPTSIPAYTKDGFERVQKLKLTSDEAQFASQFNGVRSVQQIAKNLRLDLKSAHLMLFRFLTLEIVECWPASTAIKPERKGIFERFRRSSGYGR